MTHQEKRIYALSRRALIENAGKVLLAAGAAGGLSGITRGFPKIRYGAPLNRSSGERIFSTTH